MDVATIGAMPALSQPASNEEGLRQAREQIDHITYLASLASRRDEVDVMMDTLRRVTAKWNGTGPLEDADQHSLATLEHDLKEYLVRTDPLRSFTLETLEQRVQSHNTRKGLGFISPASYSLLTIVLITIGAAGLCLVAPYMLPLKTRLLLTIPVLFTVLHMGIVWFSLTSLKNFKTDVRKVFLYFCAAAIIFAIGFSFYIVIALYHLDRFAAFRYAGLAPCFGIPFALIYLGLRSYAKLLGLQSRLLSLRLMLGICAAMFTSTVLLPHAKTSSELFFDLGTISASMIPVFAFAGSILANKIRHHVTPAYAKPMTVLCWYLRLNMGSSVLAIIALFVVGELQGAALNVVLAVCGIPPQSILLYASYLFKRETGK